MRSPSIIPADVRRKQSEASDPAVSAWVAANAGSGKTHVLAQRVINLLLAGVAPEKILCITFTKAAAANMAKRVFDTLARWTTLDDAALDAAIARALWHRARGRRRALARRLFARALETPGGLKVQTIHAFCTQLLHQFPFEANVAARFTVLDETAQAQLLEQLTLDVLLEGAAAPDSALGRALGTAMTAAADQTFRDVVREAIDRRDAVMRWVARGAAASRRPLPVCRAALGVEPRDSLESDRGRVSCRLLDRAVGMAGNRRSSCARAARPISEQAQRFRRADVAVRLRARSRPISKFSAPDESGTPRKSIVTKAIKDADAGRASCARSRQRVCAMLERRNAVVCRDRSAALLTVAHAVLTRYAAEKERRGLLDYDDLIDKALALLAQLRCGLGPLQARSRHRSRADRRGAGHQQQAVGHRPPAHRGIHRRRGRAQRHAHDLRGRRRKAVDLFVPGRRAQGIRRDAPPFRERARQAAAWNSSFSEFKHSFRSGESVLAAVDEVFKAQDIAASVCLGHRRLSAAYRAAGCARRAWSRSGSRNSPDETQRDRRLGRAVRYA